MASSKEDETAMLDALFGPISLGESVERKDNETENKEAPTKLLCSACEKESDAHKKCRNCKCVWYCDKDCQNKHWKEHRKECKRIKKVLDERGGKLDLGTEKDIGPLGKVPPREECPICMRVLPIHAMLQAYAACCGKILCSACEHQHQMKSGKQITCAFCRTAVPRSEEEELARMRKRAELMDPDALVNVAMCYGRGGHGLPLDQSKCIELHRKAAGLGYPDAQYNLGTFYFNGEMGLEQNKEEALKYWEKAAEGGYLDARHNLGCEENENGNHVPVMRHWRLAASGGYRKSMDFLIEDFEDGLLHHGDLSETLQVFYRSRGEMRSEGRDKYIKFLKMAGEYKEEYDL